MADTAEEALAAARRFDGHGGFSGHSGRSSRSGTAKKGNGNGNGNGNGDQGSRNCNVISLWNKIINAELGQGNPLESA